MLHIDFLIRFFGKLDSIFHIHKCTLKINLHLLEINTEKQHLLFFIRNKLNSKIDFSVKIDKRIEKKSAYTNKEKYELLKRKNSSMHNLKEKFKLSI